MKNRLMLGVLLLLWLNLVFAGIAAADFSVVNFRMSDQPNGPKVTKFPAGVKTVHVAFEYRDAKNMPIQVRVYNPRGDVIFQETRNYTGNGTESMTISSDVPLSNGEYVTNIFTRPELYITQTVEWVVGEIPPRPSVEPRSASQARQTPPSAQPSLGQSNVPQSAAPANPPATSTDSDIQGGVIVGGGVLILALLGLVAWAVRGFLSAS